eukprot:449058-Pelagomonas_calceolata.AAC.3
MLLQTQDKPSHRGKSSRITEDEVLLPALAIEHNVPYDPAEVGAYSRDSKVNSRGVGSNNRDGISRTEQQRGPGVPAAQALHAALLTCLYAFNKLLPRFLKEAVCMYGMLLAVFVQGPQCW